MNLTRSSAFLKVNCDYLGQCPGCTLWEKSVDNQHQYKVKKLEDSLLQLHPETWDQRKDIDCHTPFWRTYRHRADFSFSNGKRGWFLVDKEFLPIKHCDLLAPDLNDLLSFVDDKWKFLFKASLRVRVSPEGTWGVWLDLANIHIKEILEEGIFLNQLAQRKIIVEMGQKGKMVFFNSDKNSWGLKDPVPYPWFKTWTMSGPIAIKSLISSFTQTSFLVNQVLLQRIQSYFLSPTYFKAIEFGCGIGNYTKLLVDYFKDVVVFENDARNLIALKENIKEWHLESNIHSILDWNKDQSWSGQHYDLMLVNPARSGVQGLFEKEILCRQIIYVSCYLESFIKDVKVLEQKGYKIDKISILDQFPHSEHFEIISSFVLR